MTRVVLVNCLTQKVDMEPEQSEFILIFTWNIPMIQMAADFLSAGWSSLRFLLDIPSITLALSTHTSSLV